MISQGNVVLTAARRDCDLPSNGGMNVVEFSDRARKSKPSLTDLRGTVACLSSKAVTGSFAQDTNPGASCRRNYCEPNVFSLDAGFRGAISQSGKELYCEASPTGVNDCMVGSTFCGRIDIPGMHRVHYKFGPKSGVAYTGFWQIEVISWSSGYFQGTPKYHVSAQGGNNVNETPTFNVNSPYITVIIQAFSGGGGGTSEEIKIQEVWVEKT